MKAPWCRVEIARENRLPLSLDQAGIGLPPSRNSSTHPKPNPFVFLVPARCFGVGPFGTRGDSCRVPHWYVFLLSEQLCSVKNDVYWMLTAEPEVGVAISGPETLHVGAWN